MAGGGELAAAFRALAEDAAQAGENVGRSISRFFTDTAEREDASVDTTMAAEEENTRAAEAIRPEADTGSPGNGSGSAGVSRIERMLRGEDPDVAEAGTSGESSAGTGSGAPDASGPSGARSVSEMDTAGDPVDVASGDVVLSHTDVALGGVLPLVLERTHRSSHRTGRWLGASWVSSFDQRLEVHGDMVLGVFADGRILTWERPDEGADSLPEHGPVRLLRHDGDSWTVTDRQQGLVWSFEARPGYWRSGISGGQAQLPLVSVTDRTGHEIVFERGDDGAPTAVTHSGGYRIDVSVDGGKVSGLTLGGVTLVGYEYDDAGNLAGVVNSSGAPLRFSYDSGGRLTGWTDRNDYSYRYWYDERGRCVRGESPSGALSGTFSYDDETRVTTWTDGAGAVTRYRRDDPFGVTGVVDPLGHETRTDRDERGRVIASTDPLGRVTRYEFDRAGNLAAVTRPDGTIARTEHDERCLPIAVTEADGSVWRQSFDERGNRTELTAPDGGVARYGYDQAGHLASVIGPDGRTTTVTCDAAGLPVAVTSPGGARTRYERDQFGRVRSVVAPDGGVTTLTWTIEGKPASRALPDGTTESWVWDGEGNLIRYVSPSGAVTAHEYGPFDKPVGKVWPDGTRTSFGYDHEQRVTSVSHGGLTWAYSYDPAGRLVAETDYNGAVTWYSYDDAGELVRRANAAGQSVTYTRDAVSNVVSSEGDGAVTTFSYDACGRLARASGPGATIEWQRDAAGRVIAETCDGRTVATAYDPAGRVTARTTPSGATTTWAYDTAGLPAALSAGGQELRFGYDRNGREVSRFLPGGTVLAQDWDPTGQLTGQTLTGPGPSGTPVLQRRAYDYSPDGFVTGLDDLLTGSRAFALDATGCVTGITGPDWSEQYGYDPAGNVSDASWPANFTDGPLGAETQGQREVTGTLVRRAGNVSYRHDAAGRVVRRTRTRISRKPESWSYEWDADSRLVAVINPDGSSWRYSYDPLGRRVAKRHVSVTGETLDDTRFAWDGTVLAEQASADEVITWDYRPRSFSLVAQTTTRASGAGDAGPLRDAPQQEIDRRFYSIVTDLTGTPTELVASDGTMAGYQQHTLWGGTVWHPAGASTPMRFPGQYADDETGLRYNNQRYYDPVTGSYLSPDPLGLTPAPNPHRYASNPHAGIDPLGLETCMRLSSKKSIEANQAAIDARETGLAFSGVHDPASDQFEAFPSGDDPVAVVPRRGGHDAINKAAFNDSRSTVAFTAIKQEDGSLNVTWLSRGVTGRNFPGSGNLANPEQQQAILRVLQRATGRTVTG